MVIGCFKNFDSGGHAPLGAGGFNFYNSLHDHYRSSHTLPNLVPVAPAIIIEVWKSQVIGAFSSHPLRVLGRFDLFQFIMHKNKEINKSVNRNDGIIL